MARLREVIGRLGQLKKPVDDVAKVLHNLASLLLMQRRKTRRYRRVVVAVLQVGRIDL